MKRGGWRPSPLTAFVALVAAAATVLGFALTNRSVASQNQALLKSDATQAAEYVSSIASGFGSTLDALASGVTLSNGSPTEFEAQAKPLAQGPVTMILARRTALGYVVAAAAGSGPAAGRPVGPTLEKTFEKAGSTLTPAPARFDGKTSTLGFAIGPPLVPAGLAIYEQIQISPFLAIGATQAAPFHVLRASVYASRTPKADQLVLANTRSLPLQGSTAEAPVAVGNGTWWLVATARSPLAGGFPNAAPYIILAVGMALALAMASTVEVLVRRQRYASVLVAQRTAQLEASHVALMRNERLSALGEMASTVGHELRNPLAAVINAHFMLRHTLGGELTPELDRHLVMAERQTARAATLADNLTTFVRHRQPIPVALELGVVVDEVLAATPPPPGIEVTVDVPPLVIQADGDQFTQVLANLIVNGFQAMPDGGDLRIKGSVHDGDVVLTISDSGTGIDAASEDRVFDPFFTTKASGTGLGLAIVSRIIEGHGGGVTLQNGANGGAVVTIRLPITSTPELVRR
ncbi:MAG TPA: ATP-binding protein [Acidimicrobiales bacterium]